MFVISFFVGGMVMQEKLQYLMNSVKDDEFLQEYGNLYHRWLLSTQTSSAAQGPLQSMPAPAAKALVEQFITTYFRDSLDDYEKNKKQKIRIWKEETLIQFINDLKAGNPVTISNFTLTDAYDLFRVKGSLFYMNERCWQMDILDQNTFATARTLFHEWTHKMDNDYNFFATEIEADILSEAKAFYGSFLLGEYAYDNFGSDVSLSYDQIGNATITSIRQYQQFFKGNQLEIPEAWKDYPHILGYLLADCWYKSQEGKTLSEKCVSLNEAIENPRSLQKIYRKKVQF